MRLQNDFKSRPVMPYLQHIVFNLVSLDPNNTNKYSTSFHIKNINNGCCVAAHSNYLSKSLNDSLVHSQAANGPDVFENILNWTNSIAVNYELKLESIETNKEDLHCLSKIDIAVVLNKNGINVPVNVL